MAIQFSFAGKTLSRKGRVLVLLKGINLLCQPFYTYLICSHEQIEQLEKASNKQSHLDCKDFGIPVFTGIGAPTEETSQLAFRKANLLMA